MARGKDEPANRRVTDPQDPTDRSIEETLRQIGAEILDEPVPERLRRLLRIEEEPDGNPVDEVSKPE